jgi:pyranose oxidase
MNSDQLRVDALIVGSGPAGCTFARKLVEAGRSVCVVDAGPKHSSRPGAHLKNAALYQRNIDLFASVIRGHLHLLSVPSNDQPVVTLDPDAFQVDFKKYGGFTHNNQNPDQDASLNLPAAAATYGVGGMATHWTCATPRHHPTIERADCISPEDWEDLYTEGERLLNTHTDVFAQSIRHQVVRETLAAEYSELPDPYAVQNLPLAVERRTDDPRFVHWSGTDTILGPLADDDHGGRFMLREQQLCRRLVPTSDGSRIKYAEIVDLPSTRVVRVEADTFVVACGSVLTPQVLYASGIRPQALGRYLTEQPVAFCQIVLRQALVDAIESDLRFADQVAAHRRKAPHDPVPIPRHDPEPNVWIPVSEGRPWHCQIHRDAFHYGDVAPNVDARLIVDLRWFGIADPRPDNRVTFSERIIDIFEMPQPTFQFSLSAEDRQRQHLMMRDMLRSACVLGGFLPGSEPQFVAPGLPLHIAGTTRMGTDPDSSVVDPDSRVWGISNLYLGGNCLIPNGNASNPTLTTVAMALKATRKILTESS